MFSVVILALTAISLVLESHALTIDRNDNESTKGNSKELGTPEVLWDGKNPEPLTKHESRKFLQWLTNLIGTKEKKQNSTENTKKSNTREEQLHINATEIISFKAVLLNLTQVLEKINKNLELQNTEKMFYPKLSTYELDVPVIKGKKEKYYQRDEDDEYRRRKREVPTVPVISSLNSILPVTETTSAEPAKLQPATPASTTSTESGRRLLSQINQTELTQKFILYLNVTYSEIQKKITPLQHLKEMYSKSDIYKIGYITANIDILEANIRTLKTHVDQNLTELTDVKILDLFEKLLAASKIVNSLADSLLVYENRKPTGV